MVPDQGTLTQLMIMLRILQGEERPAAISREVGITLQGVQYNIRQLEKRGLLDQNGHVTKDGFSFVETYLTNLRDFVASNLSRLDTVNTWEAIADDDFSKNEKAQLYMMDGYLHARKADGHYSGIAAWDAPRDSIVGIGQVKEKIDVNIGDVLIFVVPVSPSFNESQPFREEVAKAISEKRILAVSGEHAYHLVRSSGHVPRIEFASLEGSFEAASRGLRVLLVISSRRFHFALSLIKEMETRYPEINLQIKYL
jgi:predicted transcriptional regulator